MVKKETVFATLGWILTIFSVLMLSQQGITRSFFHQDDVVELGVISKWEGFTSLGHLNNEHLNITFWPLLRWQWLVFGINFAPYLMVNILLHLAVLILLFVITYKITKSLLWASVPVWGMVINANWFAVVWWITGQMIILATIFALLTYWMILLIKEKPKAKMPYWLLYLFAVLPGLSWGVGLTWPMWPFIVFGIDYAKKRINKIGRVLLISQATLVAMYFSLIGNNLSVHTNPATWLTNPWEVVKFVIVGVSNTVVGRWLWPSENLKIRLVCLILLVIVLIAFKLYKKMNERNVLFGLLVIGGCFLTYAIPRWRFGIGHAMANYYAYFPLTFLLVAMAVLFDKAKLEGWKRLVVLAIFLIHIPLSWIGFENWARDWVVRPQQTRAYFRQLDGLKMGDCIRNDYLPEYIVPQKIYRIKEIWSVFKKEWEPFCEETIIP